MQQNKKSFKSYKKQDNTSLDIIWCREICEKLRNS